MENLTSNNFKKILVIDDQKEIQELIKISLEMMKKWRVFLANSILEVFSIAQKEKELDLILLDYLMPDINGKEMIIKLKNNQVTSHIPVIFLTAQSNIQFNWQNLGAIGVIYKPFNPINLGDLIEEILTNHS